MELVYLEPIEDSLLNRLDQVRRLEPRLLLPVATDERRTLEHDIVELARRGVVRTDRTDQRAGLEPLTAENGVARGRDRHDDVLFRCLAVALCGLRADALAECAQVTLRTAIGDHTLDGRNGCTD